MNERIQQLDSVLPAGAILQRQRFGKKHGVALWVEANRLFEIASVLFSAPEMEFDWLENLSLVQMDDALLATYFLRSTHHHDTLLIRCSRGLANTTAEKAEKVQFPSVSEIWISAIPFEQEISELFGIEYLLKNGTYLTKGTFSKLPPNSKNYPMRKVRSL